MRPSFPFILPLVLTLTLTGCHTTSLAPDAAEKANASLAKMEKNPLKYTRSGGADGRMAQLYADRPEYAEIFKREKGSEVQMPRVRSLLPPRPYRVNLKATVKVAFIVDEEGHVRDPRVFESSDTRFNHGAIAAVREWAFYPGSISGSPAKFVICVPLMFAGMED